MASMNLDRISQVMDKFEQQFEDLDVQSSYMEQAMGNSTTVTTPQDEVERLMQATADEHGLELNMQMQSAPSGVASSSKAEVPAEKDELNERLTKLRNG